MRSPEYDFLRTHERLGKRILLLGLGESHAFTSEFYGILVHYERELERTTKDSPLPDHPDMDKIEAFMEYVNKKVVEDSYT